MLYALLYPRFADQDALRIQRFRTEFEPARARMVPAHITLVFGVTSVGADVLIDRTERICAATKMFDVTFTRAAQAFDKVDGTYKVFLMPSAGEETIIAIHRHLYDGPHAAELRDDIPYRPHMTVATHEDERASAIALRETQCLRLPIPARLEGAVIVQRTGGRIEQLAEIPFSG